jgi:hypothetical protein
MCSPGLFAAQRLVRRMPWPTRAQHWNNRMREMIKGAALAAALTSALAAAGPTFAQTAKPASSPSEQAGSVIIFPKFVKGTVEVDGVTRPRTEFEIRASCPSGATCPEGEAVKIKFHWVCPGSAEPQSSYVCREVGFNVSLSVNGTALLNPEDPQLLEQRASYPAPCPNGYLIGWVIDPDGDRPIKYDGLTGSAILRQGGVATQSYAAFAIPAEPNLAIRAPIATDIDPRTGIRGLVFDGGAGHYQAIARDIPENLEYERLSGPLSSSGAFLILLALDVRLNRPNYPTFVDLTFRSDQGVRGGASWDFRCWKEIENPILDNGFTLVGARAGSAVVLAGRAVKAPYGGVSDIPGPVTLLGLVPANENNGRWTLDPVYVVNQPAGGGPATIIVPPGTAQLASPAGFLSVPGR